LVGADHDLRRKFFVGRLKVVHRQGDLPHVVRAAHPSGGLASGLHRWQQECNQYADNGNHDQQLHKRKTGGVPRDCNSLGIFHRSD